MFVQGSDQNNAASAIFLKNCIRDIMSIIFLRDYYCANYSSNSAGLLPLLLYILLLLLRLTTEHITFAPLSDSLFRTFLRDIFIFINNILRW
jgi:hypothetical protein